MTAKDEMNVLKKKLSDYDKQTMGQRDLCRAMNIFHNRNTFKIGDILTVLFREHTVDVTVSECKGTLRNTVDHQSIPIDLVTSKNLPDWDIRERLCSDMSMIFCQHLKERLHSMYNVDSEKIPNDAESSLAQESSKEDTILLNPSGARCTHCSEHEKIHRTDVSWIQSTGKSAGYKYEQLICGSCEALFFHKVWKGVPDKTNNEKIPSDAEIEQRIAIENRQRKEDEIKAAKQQKIDQYRETHFSELEQIRIRADQAEKELIVAEYQKTFNSMIGRLDRILSELIDTAQTNLDKYDKQTLKHHAEDMIGAGEKILKLINPMMTAEEYMTNPHPKTGRTLDHEDLIRDMMNKDIMAPKEGYNGAK